MFLNHTQRYLLNVQKRIVCVSLLAERYGRKDEFCSAMQGFSQMIEVIWQRRYALPIDMVLSLFCMPAENVYGCCFQCGIILVLLLYMCIWKKSLVENYDTARWVYWNISKELNKNLSVCLLKMYLLFFFIVLVAADVLKYCPPYCKIV